MRNARGANVDKSNLPRKTCPVCNRPFVWRRKWERVWDEVVYCSQRCRQTKGSSGGGSPERSR